MLKLMPASWLISGLLLTSAPVALAAQYTDAMITVSGKAGGTVDATAVCPNGYRPTGGGYDFGNPNDQMVNVVDGVLYGGGNVNYIYLKKVFIPRVVVVRSRQVGNGWNVAGYVNSDVNFQIFATCASG
ncbi:hypothetical protein [Dyella sp. Tek66A03]|uniref:hypothetical protein n=1 Tax=Dyella sp. Tek66A03 TaxID=3458298 RepID=UPI00403EBE45